MTPPGEDIRDLPISLQGIELVLKFLDENDKEPNSIRNISKNTELSMRVVKNILLQLEKFNQIERVIEKNNILPKWQITKFGKRVVKEASGIENHVQFSSKEDELIHDIDIPENNEKKKNENRQLQETIIFKLGQLQVEISKLLGPILNLGDPFFEDLIGFMIKRIKFLKQRIENLPIDLIANYTLKKMGEKQKKVSKEEETIICTEIYFMNSIIINELNYVKSVNNRLDKLIENSAITKAFSVGKDLRDELRILAHLIELRESIDIKQHIFSENETKFLIKNEITPNLLDNLIENSASEELWMEGIKDIVLKFIGMIQKGEKFLNDHNFEITESIPLFELYNLILDEKPAINFSIKQFEEAINSLANEGYIAGLKTIQVNDNGYLKIVQLIARDISEDENFLISRAIKLEKFTLAEIVKETGWSIEKTTEMLNKLTDIGIIKYSKSFLHGELWYVITNNND